MTDEQDPRDRLRKTRARLGATLDEAAEALGFNRATLWKWEDKRMGVRYPEVLHARLDEWEREHAEERRGV